MGKDEPAFCHWELSKNKVSEPFDWLAFQFFDVSLVQSIISIGSVPYFSMVDLWWAEEDYGLGLLVECVLS